MLAELLALSHRKSREGKRDFKDAFAQTLSLLTSACKTIIGAIFLLSSLSIFKCTVISNLLQGIPWLVSMNIETKVSSQKLLNSDFRTRTCKIHIPVPGFTGK